MKHSNFKDEIYSKPKTNWTPFYIILALVLTGIILIAHPFINNNI